MSHILETIKQQVTENPIVIYIKGTPDFPMCGFTGKAIQILRECQADFVSFNVLDDQELRQGIKTFGQWPTIPQLYVNGELIGGCDIMIELFESGELQAILDDAGSGK